MAFSGPFIPPNRLPTPDGDFAMGSHKITGVTDPGSAQDAATKNYVDTHGAGALTKISEKSGASANYDFTSIPGTYKHLMLVLSVRSDNAAPAVDVIASLNADVTAADYKTLRTITANTTVTADVDTTAAGMRVASAVPGAGADNAGDAGPVQIIFPNYAGTTLYKQMLATNGGNSGGGGGPYYTSLWGTWKSTSAITEITLTPSAGSFVAGCVATLYGMS